MLGVLVLAPLLGVVFGLAEGGSLGGLAATRLRLPLLLAAGFGLQVAGFATTSATWRGSAPAKALLFTALALVAGFVVANRRLAGMALVGAGLALNLAVMAANGTMPVSHWAYHAAGIPDSVGHDGAHGNGRGEEGTGEGFKHQWMNEDSRLELLGDVIPVRGLGVVVSIGDILLLVGVARLVYRRMLDWGRPESRTAGASHQSAATVP